MAYSFLNAINASLKEASLIKGADGELTTFVDSARQVDIDIMIKAWNDSIDALAGIGIMVGETSTSTITLVEDTREYSLPADFEAMAGDPTDSTNTNQLTEFPGGYIGMWNAQLDPDDFQGRPQHWAINPTTEKLRIDSDPTSGEAGEVYTFIYEKRINLSAVGDTFPFSDDVVDALQDAVVQTFNRKRKGQFDKDLHQRSLGRAARIWRQTQPRKTYGMRRASA